MVRFDESNNCSSSRLAKQKVRERFRSRCFCQELCRWPSSRGASDELEDVLVIEHHDRGRPGVCTKKEKKNQLLFFAFSSSTTMSATARPVGTSAADGLNRWYSGRVVFVWKDKKRTKSAANVVAVCSCTEEWAFAKCMKKVENRVVRRSQLHDFFGNNQHRRLCWMLRKPSTTRHPTEDLGQGLGAELWVSRKPGDSRHFHDLVCLARYHLGY